MVRNCAAMVAVPIGAEVVSDIKAAYKLAV